MNTLLHDTQLIHHSASDNNIDLNYGEQIEVNPVYTRDYILSRK